MFKLRWFVLIASAMTACGGTQSGSTPSDGGSADSTAPQMGDASNAGDASNTGDTSDASDMSDASDASDAGAAVTVTTEAGTVTITPLGSVAQSVSSAGATVTLGNASLVVPAGALTQSTTITIAADSVQAADAGATTVYEFGPEGLTFAVPATVNLPGTTGVVHWSQVVSGTTSFTDLPTTLAGGLATAPVTHFSHGYVAAASQRATIDVCQQINTTTGDITGCPAGYSCGVGPCFYDLDVGSCGGFMLMLGPIQYWGAYPIICISDSASTADGGGTGALVSCGATDTCVDIDLQTDSENCGACGNVCVAGQGCSSGACAAHCGNGGGSSNGNCGADCSRCPGTASCGGSCTDTQVDLGNCGACGNTCESGQTCTAGACVATCAGGGVCKPDGYCAAMCPAGSAVCGAAGSSAATATCTDLKTDPLNCGTCGNACGTGQGCNQGTCAATCFRGNGVGGNCGADCSGCPGTVACGSSCADTQADLNNCGACGVACGSGQTCTGGACVPLCAGGGVCTFSGYCAAACPVGSAVCGAANSGAGTSFCSNEQTDSLNCGGCGVACPSGQTCVGGTCQAPCTAGSATGGSGSTSNGP